MITSKKVKKNLTDEVEKKDGPDLQFEKLIKSVIEDQGYIKESELKQFAIDILKQIEPLISKYVKKHFHEIGNYIINNINTENIVEKKDAKNS